MTNTINSDLIRGHINTIILKTLYEGDKYGYDIVRAIEQKSNGQYKMKQPTLYSCLKRLENQGLVTAYWGARSNGGRRRYYALTEAGTQEFLKDQASWTYSKNLIDNLINSESLDFDAVSKEIDKENELENLELFNDSNINFDEETFSEEVEEKNSQNSTEIIPENSSAVLETLSSESATEEINETKSEEPKLLKEEPIKFVDTTAIMNSLINNQLDTVDSSYVDKIIAEKYTPKSTKSAMDAINYFKDFESDSIEDEESIDIEETVKSNEAPAFFNLHPYNKQIENEDNEQEIINSPERVLEKINQKYNDLKIKSETGNQMSQKTLVNLPPPVLSLYDIERQNLEKSRKLNENSDLPIDKTNIFISYDSLSPAEIDEKKAYIAREYKNVLSNLVKNNLVDFKSAPPPPPPIESPIIAPTTLAEAINPAVQYQESDLEELFKPFEGDEYEVSPIEALTRDREVNKKLNKLTSSVRELGDNVKIRTHNNDSSKEYNNEYYYYSNKLMLVHYAILFGIMILEVIFSFLFVRIGLNLKTKYDIACYLIGVLIAVAFPFIAFLANLYNPKKKKRIAFNFKSSIIARLILFVQLLICIYLFNCMLQMPLSFSKDYLATLILPILLSTNVPLSAVIFNVLYKTKKYSVEI